MVAKRVNAGDKEPRRPPAATPELREIQLQSLAYDLAEKQLRDGTASAQVITHFLKSDQERLKLEREQLKQDTLLKQARIDQIASSATHEALLREAMRAFTEYRGDEILDDE